MFNHHIEKNDQTSWHYVPTEKCFAITAREEIVAGEAIAVNYGSKCSSRFLHYYGFIPDNNTYESVPIEIALDKADPLLAEKLKIIGNEPTNLSIRELPFFPESAYLCCENDYVMSYLRFVVYSDNPLRLHAVLLKFLLGNN